MGNKSWTRTAARSPVSVEDAVATPTDVPEMPVPLAAASPDREQHGNGTTPTLAAAARPPAEADAFDIVELQVELQVEPGEDDEDGVVREIDLASLQHATALGDGMKHRSGLQAQLVQLEALAAALFETGFEAETLTTPEIHDLLAQTARLQREVLLAASSAERAEDDAADKAKRDGSPHGAARLDEGDAVAKPETLQAAADAAEPADVLPIGSVGSSAGAQTPAVPVVAQTPEQVRSPTDPAMLQALQALQAQLQALQELTMQQNQQIQQLKTQQPTPPSATNAAALARARGGTPTPEPPAAPHAPGEKAKLTHQLSYKI